MDDRREDTDHTDPTALLDVAVVGGGVGGLVAAATAATEPGARRVVLFEAHPLGGRARCDRRDGFTFNRGPRALYLGGAAHRTLEHLGVDTTAGGPPSRSGAGASDGGVVHLLPQGPGSALRTSLLTSGEKLTFARAFVRLARTDPASLVGTTVGRWLDEQQLAGATRRLFEAVVRLSTYVDAPDAFDAGAAVAAVQAATTTGVRYLDGGWQVLVDQLDGVAHAAGVERRRHHATHVAVDATGAAVLSLDDGTTATARSVVLAVGGPDAAAEVLGAVPPEWAGLGPAATAACLELGLVRPPARRFVLGIDRPTYLSTHAPPARLAPAGGAVVHAARYHRPGDEVDHALDRAELEAAAAEAGIGPADVAARRFLARMVVMGAIPLASAGGLAGRPATTISTHPGVFVAGDWVGPEGLLLDAVAASATTAARQAAARSATMAPA